MLVESVVKSCRDEFRGAHVERITVRLGVTETIQLQTLCSELDVSTTQVVRAGIRAIYGWYKEELEGDSEEFDDDASHSD